MLAPVHHILPLTAIRRERLLPVSGKVVVRKGQKVSATDVIAEAKLAPEHMLLSVTRSLGLAAAEADRHIQCQAGMQVAKGDVLAGPVGFPKRVLRAPSNGTIVVAGEGQILLEVDKPPFELWAGLPGVIADLIGERGAIIETTGALVQGVWGNGRIDFGLMIGLSKAPDHALTAEQLDVSLRGSVIMAGHCEDERALKVAADLPIRGLILASLDVSLLSLATRVRFPVILTEGFGKIAMNEAAYRLLSTNERREVVLNAENWDRFTGNRPEVIIPLPAISSLALPRDNEFFSEGQEVLIVRDPGRGQIGTLVTLRPGMTVLPSGVMAPAAEVQLENGENVVVALANLEVVA